jgi:phasin
MANVDQKTRAAKAAAATETLRATINNGAQSTADTMKSTANATKDVSDAAFSQPKFEVPEVLRSFAEQGLNQSREAYGRMKAATEEATDVLEESFESTRDSMRDVQFKALDVAQANAEATFEFARKLLSVTSVSDALQLQSSFARERFEALVDYSKDVQSTMTKVGTEASKPAKVMFDRAMSQSKTN